MALSPRVAVAVAAFGACLLFVGVALLSVEAALIVAGAAVLLVGLTAEWKGRP